MLAFFYTLTSSLNHAGALGSIGLISIKAALESVFQVFKQAGAASHRTVLTLHVQKLTHQLKVKLIITTNFTQYSNLFRAEHCVVVKIFTWVSLSHDFSINSGK